MKAKPKLGSEAGFTLLETLVALGILAIIVTSIVGGLHLGRRVWDLAPAEEERGEVEAGARALTEILTKAYPARAADTRDTGRLVFEGRADSVSFVSLSEGETQVGGLIQTRIGLDEAVGSGGRSLKLWSAVYRPQRAWSFQASDMLAVEVLRDVTSFEIFYFGPTATSPVPAWQSIWVDRDQLPQLIAVRITCQRGARYYELPLTVALRQS